MCTEVLKEHHVIKWCSYHHAFYRYLFESIKFSTGTLNRKISLLNPPAGQNPFLLPSSHYRTLFPSKYYVLHSKLYFYGVINILCFWPVKDKEIIKKKKFLVFLSTLFRFVIIWRFLEEIVFRRSLICWIKWEKKCWLMD